MSDSLIAFHPAIEEPSNIRPSVRLSSSMTPEAMVRCCHLPLGSVKRRSTHSISSSLMRERIVPGSVAMRVCPRSESVAPEQMPQARRKAGRLQRESSLGVQIPETARRVSGLVNFSRPMRFCRMRRRGHALDHTLADWYPAADHLAARALHPSFLI